MNGNKDFPVFRWIKKLGEIHALPPHRDWCLLLTLHGEISQLDDVGKIICESFVDNVQNIETFRACMDQFLGVDLADQIVGARNLDNVTSVDQQKALLLFVSKRLISGLQEQGWRVRLYRALRYGGEDRAPMASWIFDLCWDEEVRVSPLRTYGESVCEIFQGVRQIDENGTVVEGGK